MKKTLGIFIAPLFLLSSLSLSGEELRYTNNSFARLSYVKGNAYIQRASDLGYEEGVVNMPISEGDRLGTTDGLAEIYLGKGNYVRLDHDTKIDILNLPKRGYDLVRIHIWSGNMYFRVNFLEEEKNIEIHTSDVSFYVLEEGLYRIDVRENNETEIFVFHGMIEAAGETGSVLIKDEQRLEVANGRFTSRPSRFHAVAEDSFDRWSEHRDSQLRKRLAKSYLPDELEDFEYELAAYGSWTYISPYGYVWVPGGLAPGWRPYFYGRWTWLPLCGWTWIPYEPWGWCTFHFGRWHWSLGHGWYWIPTTMWGPAWVSWYWGYDYFGWVPLSYYGYPGVIINNRYFARYSGRYYPHNSRILTVIRKNQIRTRNISKAALGQESIKKIGKVSLSQTPLPLMPARSKLSIKPVEGKKVFLRKQKSPPSDAPVVVPLDKKTRKSGSDDSKKVDKKATRKITKKKSEKEGQIKYKKSSYRSKEYIKDGSYGYPSSPKISIKNSPRKIKPRKSSSILGRVYKYISGESKYIKSGSSRSSSSKSISSRSRSSSSRGTSSRRVSSSSRSSRSSSGRVKKK